MASFGKLENFDHLQNDWSIYKSKLLHWFLANDVEDETDKKQGKRKAILISSLSESSYKLVRDVIFPKDVEAVSFEEIITALDSHFQTKKCGFAERWRFHTATQEPGEEFAQWATRVRGLALHCGFTTQLRETLRDRFVLGLLPGAERQKLFQKDVVSLTLEEAVSIAQSMQSARSGAETSSITQQVCAVSTNKSAPGNTNSTNENKIRCGVCGYRNHKVDTCKFKKYKCKLCLEVGHLQKMCPKKGLFVVGAQSGNLDNSGDGEFPIRIIGNIRCRDGEPMLETVKLAGKVEVCFHIDTGSHVTAIPDKIYIKYFENVKLEPSKINLINYTGGAIATLGKIRLPVTYDGRTHELEIYVIPHSEVALLGRDFISTFALQLCYIRYGNLNTEDTIKAKMYEKYPEVFAEKLGRFKRNKVHLTLKPEAKPIFFKARTVPFALRQKLDGEIDRLVSERILVPVSHSDYATPVVPVLKSNGTIRLCADYSVSLNKLLEIEKYPLPKIEELFVKLYGGEEFTKLDLSSAYNQLELDEESQPLTCINTHKGLFQYTRLVFGLSSSPAIFQRALESILADIPGVLVFLDDILITGRTRSEHVDRLNRVFNRLNEAGLVLQKSKCMFLQQSISYLGYVIDKNGLHKSEEKVRAVIQAENPKNVTQLKSFLGMVNYYRNFIPDAATVLSPLNNLLRKDVKWLWTEQHEQAVIRIKSELASERVLAHYNPQAQLSLICDAGPEGVSAILSQVENGRDRPIAYASRSLAPAERNYSQLQKEATAIIFGVKRFHHYLYGRQEPFLLKSDHKPLLSIFGPHKGIPEVTANRLQRYALYLSAYNFRIEYIKGVDNAADFLSRSPLPLREEGPSDLCSCVEDRASYINFVTDGQLPVTREDIRRETKDDSVLRSVVHFVQIGWPARNRDVQLGPYFHCRLQLSYEEGCLMRGHKLVIPPVYRQRMLNELHRSHLGIVKTKAEARSRFWWPQIDADIERHIGGCVICNQLRPSPPCAPPAQWQFPPHPWYRVHLDFLGPINDSVFLVMIDAYTKWPEVFIMNAGYSANALIEKVEEVMARFGVPHTFVSDNGSTFTSGEFQQFCKLNGIKCVTSPPYHPPSNGQAEAGVKFTKKAIKSIMDSCSNKKQMQAKLLEFLFQYRNSVHTTTERSPANLLFGRQLRSRLDILRFHDAYHPASPDTAVAETVKKNQLLQARYHGGRRTDSFNIGDNILFKVFKPNKKYDWHKGVITEILGTNTYLVYCNKLKATIKKHLDHIVAYKGPIEIAGAPQTRNPILAIPTNPTLPPKPSPRPVTMPFWIRRPREVGVPEVLQQSVEDLPETDLSQEEGERGEENEKLRSEEVQAASTSAERAQEVDPEERAEETFPQTTPAVSLDTELEERQGPHLRARKTINYKE